MAEAPVRTIRDFFDCIEEALGNGTKVNGTDSLNDGVILLRFVEKTFPALSLENVEWYPAPRTLDEVNHNWQLLAANMEAIGLPVEACNLFGVASGNKDACYNLLAMLYFLYNVSHQTLLTARFSQKLDPRIQQFLESDNSLLALHRGGVASHEHTMVRITGT
eukprot:Sspe_Gene.114252::Locus_99741_Transcript_1_1_Confidence_1.000_Length_574::g.114252::m.114252